MALVKSLVLLTVCLVKPSFGDTNQCPSVFKHSMESLNKCYAVVTDPMNWDAAQAKCKQLNPDAHLVVITSALENQFISEILNKYECRTRNGGNWFWTSGRREHDDNCHSNFLWKSFSRNHQALGYTNFCPQEPDCASRRHNNIQKQNCVTFAKFCYRDHSINGWQDDFCSQMLCPICELLTT